MNKANRGDYGNAANTMPKKVPAKAGTKQPALKPGPKLKSK